MSSQEKSDDTILDCEMCGTRPAHSCFLENVEGRILYYRTQEYVGHLCARCLTRVYIGSTLRNLLLGWWSIYGFARTPFVIGMNTFEIISCLFELRRRSNRMRG